MTEALAHIHSMLRGDEKGYVCCADVHGIMEAQRHPEVAKAYADSAMTLPDGMPLVWMGRQQHFRHMERVCGPDLMLEVFTRPEFRETTHYLYGGREMVAQELRDRLLEKNPDARIVGVRTPPFRELTAAEEQELIQDIAELKPDVLWVGISCPKQELFMTRHVGKLDTKLMFGVGAAFDYHTDRIRDSAPWVKRAGLQWLHRLLQDPKRLWRRYLRNNPAFVWRVLLQVAGAESPALKQGSQQTPPVNVHPSADTTIG
jgi:N-acetylglucosaminyldiphosphoundecaprenol N-acetyl-beta-D-mannosaminyltransferase